jgi:hypothetical protein
MDTLELVRESILARVLKVLLFGSESAGLTNYD